MNNDDSGAQRRAVLKTAVGLAVGAGVLHATHALAADGAAPLPTVGAPSATVAMATKRTPGRPGDFDWLAGEWKIRHRRLKAPGEWDEFEGEATCWTILGGVGSVEELRIPARDFSGLGLRLLDLETRVWSDYWVNARSGVLGAAGLTGSFENGDGVFLAEEVDGDTPILVRGLWDAITATSHRWTQGVSRDGGKTWDDNWLMQWTRA